MSDTGAITIAQGDILDLDAVMRVMDDSFDPCFGEAWTASQCAGLLPMPGVRLALARDGDGVVGFALSRVVAREAELLLLAVKRDVQRRGIGELLLNHFIEFSASKGAAKLHLEVRSGNPAVKLYNSFGFAELGRRKHYYKGRDGQLHDALTLGRSVTV